MKLVIAIIQDRDANDLLQSLVASGYRATKLASTGGFLRGGNTTMLIGVDEEKVGKVLEIVHHTCKPREQHVVASSPAAATGEPFVPFPTTVKLGGAVVFVVDVDRFEKW